MIDLENSLFHIRMIKNFLIVYIYDVLYSSGLKPSYTCYPLFSISSDIGRKMDDYSL